MPKPFAKKLKQKTKMLSQFQNERRDAHQVAAVSAWMEIRFYFIARCGTVE